MSEMVDKVARALRADEWRADEWDSATAEDQEYWRRGARVAIGAMRTPTDKMMHAAVMTHVRENGGIEHAPFASWQAMIGEAMK